MIFGSLNEMYTCALVLSTYYVPEQMFVNFMKEMTTIGTSTNGEAFNDNNYVLKEHFIKRKKQSKNKQNRTNGKITLTIRKCEIL